MTQENVSDPADFLKCPNCHRSGTVEITVHLDGDVTIKCNACNEHGFGHKLHESDRTYS